MNKIKDKKMVLIISVILVAAAIVLGAIVFGGKKDELKTAEVTMDVEEPTSKEDVEGTDNKDGTFTDEAGFVSDGTVLVGYVGEGGDISIPTYITEIADGAFESTENIATMTIPATVGKIGDAAIASKAGSAAGSKPEVSQEPGVGEVELTTEPTEQSETIEYTAEAVNSGFIIYGKVDSEAERYAMMHHITFIVRD